MQLQHRDKLTQAPCLPCLLRLLLMLLRGPPGFSYDFGAAAAVAAAAALIGVGPGPGTEVTPSRKASSIKSSSNTNSSISSSTRCNSNRSSSSNSNRCKTLGARRLHTDYCLGPGEQQHGQQQRQQQEQRYPCCCWPSVLQQECCCVRVSCVCAAAEAQGLRVSFARALFGDGILRMPHVLQQLDLSPCLRDLGQAAAAARQASAGAAAAAAAGAAAADTSAAVAAQQQQQQRQQDRTPQVSIASVDSAAPAAAAAKPQQRGRVVLLQFVAAAGAAAVVFGALVALMIFEPTEKNLIDFWYPSIFSFAGCWMRYWVSPLNSSSTDLSTRGSRTSHRLPHALRLLQREAAFLGTLICNIAATSVSVLAASLLQQQGPSPEGPPRGGPSTRALKGLAVGFAASLSTMSTFCAELKSRRGDRRGYAYGGASVVLSFALGLLVRRCTL
ncbi:hypothetical protein Esti_001195 [Eimeria stiedai]